MDESHMRKDMKKRVAMRRKKYWEESTRNVENKRRTREKRKKVSARRTIRKMRE